MRLLTQIKEDSMNESVKWSWKNGSVSAIINIDTNDVIKNGLDINN